MAGLMNLPQQGDVPADPAAAPAAAPADDGSGDTGETPNVTPEEQAAYDQFVKNGMEVIYSDEGGNVRPDILNRLRQHPDDPIHTLANVAVWLTINVEQSAEQSGAQIDDDVLMHGGIALLEELAEVSGAAKIHTYDEKEVNAATLAAMDLYREAMTQSGKIDPEQLKQEFGQIVAADKAGNVASVLPQIKDGAPTEEAPAEPAPDEEQV